MHDFVLRAEQRGLHQVGESPVVRVVVEDLVESHVDAFQVAFAGSAVIGLLGALACFVLVRRTGRVAEGPILGHRSRWILAGRPREGPSDRR